jgi:hypothetical protein
MTLGTIYGPRVRTTTPRIDFWHGIDFSKRSWESVYELVQQRRRWVAARYGDEAFETKPLLEGYSEFDLGDAGYSWDQYRRILQPRDLSQVRFVLNRLEAEHAERHFVRLRPHCPTCRGSRILARLSLCMSLADGQRRRVDDASDATLGWDTERVQLQVERNQADLYLNRAQLAQLAPPQDLIEGIIPSRGVGYITGRDRSLKTFLAIDIMMTVATMMPAWHRAGADGKDRARRRCDFRHQGKVIFAAGEGVHSFGPRMDAWVAEQHVKGYGDPKVKTADGTAALRRDGCAVCANETDPDVGHVGHLEFVDPEDVDSLDMRLVEGLGGIENRNIVIRQGTPNLFAGGDDYLYLLALARRERPDLVVLDTLALSSGAADQQAASDMGVVHERAAMIAEASGGVVLIVAHTDKADNDARGSSVIEDNSDFVLHCLRVDDDQLEVTVAKRKDAEDNWKFQMGVKQVDLEWGQTSLILKDFDGDKFQSQENLDAEKIDDLVGHASRMCLEQQVTSFKANDLVLWIGKTGFNRPAVSKLLNAAIKLELVEKQEIPGQPTLWRLSDRQRAHLKQMGQEVDWMDALD